VDGAAEEPEAAEDRALPRDTLLLDHTSLPDDYLASSFEQMASPVMRTMDETEVVIDRSAGGSLWPSQSFDSPEVETLPVADPAAFDIPASPGIEPPDDSAADDLPVASVVDGAVSAGEGGEEPPEVDAQAQAGPETSLAIPGEGKKAGLIETLAHLPDRVLHGEESLEEALLRRLSSTTIHAFDGEVQNLRATILVKGGFEGESTHRFDQFPITLGSGISCDVVLSDLRPRHARVLYRDGRFVLYNLIGADDPSEHWAVVEDGDEISLGPYRLRFLAETA
jgi:hypothetical protein